ncbi:MAG: SDR family NAD(P)-dependent oxidoreductase [Polyangiaceae bacterium]
MNRTTILVTGANTGIGRACAEQLAAPGIRLVLACRSREKTEPVLDEVRKRGAEAEFLKLDLGDLSGAAEAGRAFARANDTLDVLINNAGLAGSRGTTRDGYELAFGTNHLGHFAFTLPLLPLLEKRASSGRGTGRIVNVSSGNHLRCSGIDFDALRTSTKSRTGLPEYGVSKLANVLFTAELRRRHPNITSVSMNPGRIASDVWRSAPPFVFSIMKLVLPMGTVETGGATLVHAMNVTAEPGEDLPLFFNKQKPQAANPLAHSEDLASKLWAYSEEAVAAAMASSMVSPAQAEASHGATA